MQNYPLILFWKRVVSPRGDEKGIHQTGRPWEEMFRSSRRQPVSDIHGRFSPPAPLIILQWLTGVEHHFFARAVVA